MNGGGKIPSNNLQTKRYRIMKAKKTCLLQSNKEQRGLNQTPQNNFPLFLLSQLKKNAYFKESKIFIGSL